MHTSALAAATRKLTYRDFMKFPDDGKRHELIDGVHYMTPSPFTPHQAVLGNLYFLIRQHLEQHPGGRAFMAPFDVVLSMFDVVEPDLLFISESRMRVLTDKHVHGAPDLVVEIASRGTRRRDEGVKLKLYDRMDVAEYWIIDADAETIRVFRRRSGKLACVDTLAQAPDARLKSPLLPGAALPLARIFEK
jgi:Uma2 family endonuclease